VAKDIFYNRIHAKQLLFRKCFSILLEVCVIEVRLATLNDSESLFMLNKLFGNATTIEDLKNSLSKNKRELVCIAFVDGVAAGYACGLIIKSMCYSKCRADIEALFVREEYREKGMGKALLACLEKELERLGINHFHIITHEENNAAKALYTRLGYIADSEFLLEKTTKTP